MALNFPNSPTIGDEFTGGGFTWTWTGSAWEKVAIVSTTTGFNLDIGTSGNTTFVLPEIQPAGGYSITSQALDTTLEFYAIASDGTLAGYTNTKALTTTKDFTKIVVYGGTNNDLISFEFKTTTVPTSSGDLDSGAGPFITSATPVTLESIDDTTTVTGGNFATDVEVKFIGTDAVDRPAKNIVRTSSTQLIVTRPDAFPVSAEPFSMVASNPGITNPSTNVNRLANYFDAGGGITWTTAAGMLPTYTINVPYSTTISATDADGLAVSYSLQSGILPSGLSLNSSTGVISGTVTAASDQTFTIRATDTGGNISDRQFSIAQPLSVEYLVIAGGGGGAHIGGSYGAGGGGAGGYRSSVSGESSGGGASAESPIVAIVGTNYTVTVGAGGSGGGSVGGFGNNSVFSNITSTRGGGGAGSSAATVGGSGGGASTSAALANGTINQGFAGGAIGGSGNGTVGGGGGGAAETGSTDGIGNGGDGLASSITGAAIFRGGGGGGAGWNGWSPAGSRIGGEGGGGSGSGSRGGDGTANTGGGGGGGSSGNGIDPSVSGGGNGGSGVVILRYPSIYTITTGAGLTASTSTVGSNKVTTFTAGTGTVSWS